MIKKTLTAAIVGVTAALTLAPLAHADYPWVADESADICANVSIPSDTPDADMASEISYLQVKYSITRAVAVSGIQQAVSGYCSKYISVVPTR